MMENNTDVSSLFKLICGTCYQKVYCFHTLKLQCTITIHLESCFCLPIRSNIYFTFSSVFDLLIMSVGKLLTLPVRLFALCWQQFIKAFFQKAIPCCCWKLSWWNQWEWIKIVKLWAVKPKQWPKIRAEQSWVVILCGSQWVPNFTLNIILWYVVNIEILIRVASFPLSVSYGGCHASPFPQSTVLA